TSLMSSSAAHRASQPMEVPPRAPGYGAGHRSGRGSVRRWLVVVAALAALTVAVTWAINTLGGNTRDVQVPNVAGQSQADAIATLQNKGFKTRTQQKPDSTVPPDHVIDTDPRANETVDANSQVTINISTGPEQREIPDVANLAVADAMRRLTAAGFGKVKQVPTPSAPEQKDRVVGTSPPANQTAPVTFEISVLVGSGPESVDVPDVGGQTADQARATLTAAGFTNVVDVQVNSPKNPGDVTGTSPPAGQSVPKDALIQLQLSKGNQFVMPNLLGYFWTDAEPLLRGLGWTGQLIPGPSVQNSGQRLNAVVGQSPSAGSAINKDGNITLSFAS